jgi:hypothetical protein
MIREIKEWFGIDLKEVCHIREVGNCYEPLDPSKVSFALDGEILSKDKKKIKREVFLRFNKKELKKNTQLWRLCGNPRCLNIEHMVPIEDGQTSLMGVLGFEYWKRRKYFQSIGYLPTEKFNKKKKDRLVKKFTERQEKRAQWFSYRKKASVCRYCMQDIFFLGEKNKSLIPYNKDGTGHKCKERAQLNEKSFEEREGMSLSFCKES